MSQTDSRADAARLTIGMFCALIATALTLVYYVGRVGFAPVPAYKALLLAYFLAFLPVSWRVLARRLEISPDQAWWATDAVAIILGVVALCLAGLINGYLGVDLSLFFFAVGLVSFLVFGFRWLRGDRWFVNLLFGAGVLFFTAFLLLVWTSGYLNILFEEGMITGVSGHQDTLFHAAISNIFRTYGVPSTGLEGLVPINYHIGSHWIYGQIANLFGVGSLTFYQFGFPIIFIPFLFLCLLVAAVNLQKTFSLKTDAIRPLRRDFSFWVLLLFANVGLNVLPASWQGSSHLLSESYLLGLSCLALCLSLGVYFVRIIHTKGILTATQTFFLFVVVPILLVIAGSLKISIMLILLAVYAYLFLSRSLYKRLIFIIALFVTFAAGFIGYLLFAATGAFSAEISLFYAISRYFDGSHFYFFSHFSWSWLFIGLMLFAKKVRTISDLYANWKEEQLLPLEIVVVASIAAAAPGLVFKMESSSYYFSDIQRWIALVFLLATVPIIFARHPTGKFFSREMHLGKVALFGIGLLLLISAIRSISPIPLRLLDINWEQRKQITNVENPDSILGAIAGAAQQSDFDRVAQLVSDELMPLLTSHQAPLELMKLHPIFQALHTLGDLPSHEKRRSLLYIPKTNNLYWNLPTKTCWARPFVAPAISGIAMIDGMPPGGCHTNFYGYWRYPRVLGSVLQNADGAELCDAVRAKGFEQLWVLDLEATGDVSLNLLPCVDDPEQAAAYRRPPEDLADIFTFNESLVLRAWHLKQPVEVESCQKITLESWWTAREPLKKNYTLSLVLTDAGMGIAKGDAPLSSLLPQDWEPSTAYWDVRSLTIPCDIEPGEYPLLLIVYDEQMVPLPVTFIDGSLMGEQAYLTTLIVK